MGRDARSLTMSINILTAPRAPRARHCASSRFAGASALGVLEEYAKREYSDRLTKKSRYIPKRLVQRVERMNDEKVAVRKIKEVLGVEGL